MVSLVPKETCMRLFTAAQLVLAKLWELLKYPNTSPHCSWGSFLIVQVSSCPSPAPNLSLAPCCQISFPLVPCICPYSLPLKLYSIFSSHIELTSTSRPFSFTHKALCVLILPYPQLISYPLLCPVPDLPSSQFQPHFHWLLPTPLPPPPPPHIARYHLTMKSLVNFPNPRGTTPVCLQHSTCSHLLEHFSKGSAPCYLPFLLSSLGVACIQAPYPSCLSVSPHPQIWHMEGSH